MKIFLTPMLDKSKSPTKNPYIDDLISALESNGHEIVNKDKFSKIGLFDAFGFIHKIDAVYFNWIEDLVSTRFGLLQTIYIYFFALVCKILNIKIIWMLHNQVSHSKDNLFVKIINTYMLINYADIVLTHAKDGITFAEIFKKNQLKQIHFRHHPVKKMFDDKIAELDKVYDILIWGSITPYKGILELLKFLESNNILDKYKIKIVGKINSQALKNEILSYASDSIDINDEFLSDEELKQLHRQSKIVLFTYMSQGTFASGSLMWSIGQGSQVVGPNIGAFKDLNQEGVINVYDDFFGLVNILDQYLNVSEKDSVKLEEFIEKHSWNQFGKYLAEKLMEIK